jgi:Polyketide cyclase / dehydrase and lipid transport
MRIRAKSAFAILASIAVIVVVFLIPLPRSAALDTHVVTSTWIHRSPTVVFDFVTTPGHWPAWHPSSLSVSGQTDHPLDVGERVTEAFRVAGRRGLVVWTVRARDNPRKWSIDGEIDGRFAGTVTYRLAPEATGTRFMREFTYRAPSLWFAMINWIVLRKKIQSESDQAVARLKVLLESPLPQ